MHDQHTVGVTPFVPGQRAAESEKSRTRRQSTSLRVTNEPRAMADMTEDEVQVVARFLRRAVDALGPPTDGAGR